MLLWLLSLLLVAAGGGAGEGGVRLDPQPCAEAEAPRVVIVAWAGEKGLLYVYVFVGWVGMCVSGGKETPDQHPHPHMPTNEHACMHASRHAFLLLHTVGRGSTCAHAGTHACALAQEV